MAIVYTDNVYNFNIYMSCPRLDPSLLPESKDVHPDMAGEQKVLYNIFVFGLQCDSDFDSTTNKKYIMFD